MMASTPYWIWMTIFKCDLKQYWRFLEVWEQALVAVKNRRFRNYHLHIYSLCSESRFLQCSLKELLADKLDTAERNPMAWIAFFMYLENKYLVFFDKSMSLVQQNYNELNILVWEIHLWSYCFYRFTWLPLIHIIQLWPMFLSGHHLSAVSDHLL